MTELTGFVSIEDNMCINSHHAFTGPLADHKTCFIGEEPRYNPVEYTLKGTKVPCLRAMTFPLDPQLQA